MKHARLPALLTLLLLLACMLTPASGADTAAAKQHELDVLRMRIAKVQADMDLDIHRRSAVQLQLRKTERDIARQSTGLHDLDRSIARAQAQLDALHREQAQQQAALDAQKDALAAQIRAAFMQGQDSRLQLLLNAQDPTTISRLLTYYDYLNKARAARIQAVRAQLDALAVVNAQVAAQLDTLNKLRVQRAPALAQLQQTRDARKQLLVRINASIENRGAELTGLRRDEQSIEQLLANLRQALADIPADLERSHRFVVLKGRLPWPVEGRVIHRFGEPLMGGKLKAQGDLIAAPLGTAVRAVSWGRVVYADWLPHFGLLVIIDHGDGYMSIYAHNQSIYTQVGDWVHAGETIATLGDSGGQSEPALYFEIRHKNRALNPRQWCRGRLARG